MLVAIPLKLHSGYSLLNNPTPALVSAGLAFCHQFSEWIDASGHMLFSAGEGQGRRTCGWGS